MESLESQLKFNIMVISRKPQEDTEDKVGDNKI
jgi:hypothetical protein